MSDQDRTIDTQALIKDALAGDVHAQFQLAIQYHNGDGVEKDDAKAFEYMLLAAKNGDKTAQSNVAKFYSNGQGTSVDMQEAVRWMESAIDREDADLGDIALLAVWYADDIHNMERAVKYYQIAADRGHIASQCILADRYRSGDGVEKDETKCFAYTLMAANGSVTIAKKNLAKCYMAGTGTPINVSEALRWMKSAVEDDDADAMLTLGIWYSNGEHIPKDSARALRLYEMAAERGNADAMLTLGIWYIRGEHVPKDSARALRLYEMAAERGNADAQYMLGSEFLQGKICPEDLNKAEFWLKKAESAGSKYAARALQMVMERKEEKASLELEKQKLARAKRILAEDNRSEKRAFLKEMKEEEKQKQANIVVPSFWLKPATPFLISVVAFYLTYVAGYISIPLAIVSLVLTKKAKAYRVIPSGFLKAAKALAVLAIIVACIMLLLKRALD